MSGGRDLDRPKLWQSAEFPAMPGHYTDTERRNKQANETAAGLKAESAVNIVLRRDREAERKVVTDVRIAGSQ